ncbi:secreted protein [Melampsora americana]|nr:secreted protein [Melampsora americana]
MKLIKSIFVATIEIFLLRQAAGSSAPGWGEPRCFKSPTAKIQGTDCVEALHQFFATSDVYTSDRTSKTESDWKQSYGSCSVTLGTPDGGCEAHEEYLRSAKSPKIDNSGGERGGLDALITTCVDTVGFGLVSIPDDPEVIKDTPRSCTWQIEITPNKD